MAGDLFKKEVTREERIYKSAESLEEATKYVLRFERKVNAFRSAAKQFQSISQYKDAAERARYCGEQAELAEKEGLAEVFSLAQRKEQEAKTKSDYVDAIAEYKRVWKREAYAEEAKIRIDACKAEIMKLENRSIWKKRMVTLAVIAVLVLIFINTDAYPFCKGMIHQATGDYKASIVNFRDGKGVPWAEGKMKKSYLYLGQEYLKEGKKDAALRAFRKAENTLEAPEEAAKLEQEILAKANPGEEVRFGKGRWAVLEQKNDYVLLLYQKKGTRMIYSQEEVSGWEDSKIYQWLNTSFVNANLSLAERDISFASGDGTANQGEYATLLTQKEWEKYQDLLETYPHNWWLKDKGLSTMGASYVDKEGKVTQTYVNSMTCCVRPVIWVKVK